jgi:hypothetical protein
MPTVSKANLLFDRSPNEIAESLFAVISNELKNRKAKNLPVVYKNSMCINKNEFIHEYPDGRKFLISQDINTSEETIIRQF